MATMDELRAGVRMSLPELQSIKDVKLRDLVVEAWAYALSQTEFTRIEDMPGSGVPGSPRMKNGTQANHLRGVARMAAAMADALEQVMGPLGIDRDVVLAAGLCHDLGKPFEYSPANRARWQSDPGASGYPAVRHPVYGAHVALTVGLPEVIVNAACAHSAEGEKIQRSLATTLVHFADEAFWYGLERAGALTTEPEDAEEPAKA